MRRFIPYISLSEASKETLSDLFLSFTSALTISFIVVASSLNVYQDSSIIIASVVKFLNVILFFKLSVILKEI